MQDGLGTGRWTTASSIDQRERPWRGRGHCGKEESVESPGTEPQQRRPTPKTQAVETRRRPLEGKGGGNVEAGRALQGERTTCLRFAARPRSCVPYSVGFWATGERGRQPGGGSRSAANEPCWMR